MEKATRFIKNNYQLLLFYLIISAVFTLELIVYINDSGDQTVFAAESTKYGFFEYAIYRYQTWSSRLLIESLTMFMSGHHYIVFDITFLGAMFLFLYSLNKVIFPIEENYRYASYIFPIILLVTFPGLLFTSAGLIPTVTNYLFPLFSLVIGWYLLSQKNKILILLAFIAVAFAFMQEQFTVFGFILSGFFLVLEFVRKRSIDWRYAAVFLLSLAGLISVVLSPGSDKRLTQEIATWYPGFEKLSLLTKVLKGYLETNRILFVTAELNIFMLLLIVIIVLSILKRQFLATTITGLTLYTIVINRLGITNLFTAIQRIIDGQNNRADMLYFSIKENLYPLIVYTVLLVALAIIIFFLFEEKVKGLIAVVILVSGYATRMLVSLSPTIYASQLRTYIPLVFAILVVILLLIKEAFPLVKENNVLKNYSKNHLS
ncbi:hypothetical protein [Streptococcus dentiloxodontae]